MDNFREMVSKALTDPNESTYDLVEQFQKELR